MARKTDTLIEEAATPGANAAVLLDRLKPTLVHLAQISSLVGFIGFIAAIALDSAIFRMWGLTFLQIATTSDVILSGLQLAVVFLFPFMAIAFGWWIPNVYVDRTRRLRYDQMNRQMPDMIDLLIVTIEAGLGILASMRVASETLRDPLGQELRLTLQEQRMGLSVGEAITSLGRRADCDNMRIFVRALTQGEKLGVSIGKTMRDLA